MLRGFAARSSRAPGALEPHHCRRHRLGWREHKGDAAHNLRRTAQCILPGATGAGVSPFQAAALVLAEPAVHASHLAGPLGPLQAGLNDLTLTAEGLGVICPVQRGPCPGLMRTLREPQINVKTCPAHRARIGRAAAPGRMSSRCVEATAVSRGSLTVAEIVEAVDGTEPTPALSASPARCGGSTPDSHQPYSSGNS